MTAPEIGIMDRLLLTGEEAAALLGVSRATFYRAAADGEVPEPVALRGSRRWAREELTDWTRAGCPPRWRWIEIKRDGKTP